MLGRQTFAIIDLKALKHNYGLMSQYAHSSKTIAVIKADAYGHGAKEVAEALTSQAEAFAVAFIDEAVMLRNQGIKNPILLLEGVLNEEEMRCAQRLNLWVTIHSPDHFNCLRALDSHERPVCWIKIDTGMHRLGISLPIAEQVLSENSDLLNENTVLCSHLASADEPNNPFTLQQNTALRALASKYHLALSIANSAGISNWPDCHGHWNRLGISLYGCAQSAQAQAVLKPVMSLHAPVIAVRNIQAGESVGYGQSWIAQRPSTIATVAIGYADGYPRHAKTGTPAWLNNQRINLVGRVSMDLLTFDVTDVPQVKTGDSVELWGNNIAVETVAEHASTIAYELLTRVSARVKRRYIA